MVMETAWPYPSPSTAVIDVSVALSEEDRFVTAVCDSVDRRRWQGVECQGAALALRLAAPQIVSARIVVGARQAAPHRHQF